jgi:hypothetical protein
VAAGVAQQTARKTREQKAAELAAELIVFADGAEEAGLVAYAQRARVVARETIWLVDALEGERSARRAIQEARDRCVQILANQAGRAT